MYVGLHAFKVAFYRCMACLDRPYSLCWEFNTLCDDITDGIHCSLHRSYYAVFRVSSRNDCSFE